MYLLINFRTHSLSAIRQSNAFMSLIKFAKLLWMFTITNDNCVVRFREQTHLFSAIKIRMKNVPKRVNSDGFFCWCCHRCYFWFDWVWSFDLGHIGIASHVFIIKNIIEAHVLFIRCVCLCVCVASYSLPNIHIVAVMLSYHINKW